MMGSASDSEDSKNVSEQVIGFIGLGRMGKNMVFRLLNAGIKVVAWNRSKEPLDEVAARGAVPASSIGELVSEVSRLKEEGSPAIVWIMLPAGQVTEDMINAVSPLLRKGDILVDGGNSNFHDSIRRHDELFRNGVFFVDVGTSGGLAAAERGYCMMAGGSRDAYDKLVPFMAAMCVPDGYGYMGPGGSGHYVKMVHNAIEYGMMQAIAEGFDLLANGRFKELDLAAISSVWNHGSIIQSFLLQMAENALSKGTLDFIEPFVQDTGEGRWAVFEALEHNVPFTVNSHALFARYASRDRNSLAYRMIAALRNEFGGHEVKRKSG